MTIVDFFRRDENRVLDRLVDGELSQAERRELLAALEDEPGAWRRCALVFLEAQSWRWQLGQLAAEPIVAHAAADRDVVSRAAGGSGSRAGLWGTCLAVAAGLLVAFGLGTQFPSAGNRQLAANGSNAPAQPSSQSVAGGAEGSRDSDEPDWPSENSSQATEDAGWETLTLAAAGDAAAADNSERFEVRVRDPQTSATSLSELLAGTSAVATTRLLEQLEQEGWRVTRERRFLPVDLSDGRRMIVPVEEVDIRNPEAIQF